MNDDELIAAVAGGDDVGPRGLFSRHAPWLASRLGRLLADDAAEEVLQETFLAVWRGAKTYQPGVAGAWLWGIARRQAALWIRRNRPLEALQPVHQADPHAGTLTRIELEAAVAALSEADRE